MKSSPLSPPPPFGKKKSVKKKHVDLRARQRRLGPCRGAQHEVSTIKIQARARRAEGRGTRKERRLPSFRSQREETRPKGGRGRPSALSLPPFSLSFSLRCVEERFCCSRSRRLTTKPAPFSSAMAFGVCLEHLVKDARSKSAPIGLHCDNLSLIELASGHWRQFFFSRRWQQLTRGRGAPSPQPLPPRSRFFSLVFLSSRACRRPSVRVSLVVMAAVFSTTHVCFRARCWA